jgi:hypothetical protein
MTRKTRSQRQRTARARTGVPVPPTAASASSRGGRGAGAARGGKEPAQQDRMALYRSLASPGVPARLLLILGLLLLSISQGFSKPSATASPLAALGLAGGLCVLLFVIAGMMRHYRALFRIRRDEPAAWQPTLSFAMASLAVPLGFSGPAGTPRDRLLRRITLILVLAYALTTIVALGRK